MVNAPPSLLAVGNETPLRQTTAHALLWIEKYPLPLLYVWLAWQRWRALNMLYREYHLPLSPIKRIPGWENLFYANFARVSLLFALLVFTAITLLFNRAPSVVPDKLKHVVVPLAMSYYFVLYTLVDRMPLFWSRNFAPVAWMPTLTLAGLLFSAVGFGVSLWAICYLRRSFAVLVAVRRVVLGGPYAFVRHPMYLGYLLDTVGLLLITCSPAMCLLAAGFLVLMAVRARLEEGSLADASEEYRRHCQRTGAFFPRWSRIIGR